MRSGDGHDDESGEDWDEEDDSTPGDGDEFEEDQGIPCPFCRRELAEDAAWCSACERFITEEDWHRAGRPTWVSITALVCLAMALLWAFASL